MMLLKLFHCFNGLKFERRKKSFEINGGYLLFSYVDISYISYMFMLHLSEDYGVMKLMQELFFHL